MHFSFILFLLVFVSGCCDSSRRNGVRETSKAFWKSLSKAGKIIHAGQLAQKIHGHITSAMLRENPFSALAHKNQFAWIYLHGPYEDVTYDNDIVRNVLLSNDPFPTVTSQWPENAFETNLMFAIPDEEAFGTPTDHSGHAEHIALQNLEDMRLGFLNRYQACPDYTIFGSVRDPCRYSKKKTGCAYDMIGEMKEFTANGKCPTTAFMVYVHQLDKKYRKFWPHTKQLLIENGFGVKEGWTDKLNTKF